MVDNVTRLPEAPHRCEYPHCLDPSEGLAKKFNKKFCSRHRKQMLLCASYLAQLDEEQKKAQGEEGLIQRLHQASTKAQAHFMIDKRTMDEIKGALVDQAAKIAKLETTRD